MRQFYKLFYILLLTKICLSSFGVYNVAYKIIKNKIYPSKVLEEIPKKLGDKIKEYVEDNNDIQSTSYTFPVEYKTTLYKDHEKKTTLVNVFPTMETKPYTPSISTPGYQVLETSTTLLQPMLNMTIALQTIPMLNSTLVYPTTAPVQPTLYVTPEYQHEIHVYPTKVNFTQIASTTLVNFTKVNYVDNMLPFV